MNANPKFIAEAAHEAGLAPSKIFSFDMADDARKPVQDMLKQGDLVLVKGSQSMRMERAVEALMAESERAANLLVRQEPEWLLKT